MECFNSLNESLDKIIIGVIIGLIVGILLKFLIKLFDKNITKTSVTIKDWWFRIRNKFSQNKSLEDFFYIYKSYGSTDIVAYQFGLRANLPIIDILYLELLKRLVKENKINKIAIFPTIDKSALSQISNDYNIFQRNIHCVFSDFKDCILFVDPFEHKEIATIDFIEDSFIDSLNYLGSSDFYTQILNTSNHKVKSFQDFNKFHPKERYVMTLFTHVMKAWQVRNYIFKHIEESGKGKMNVGFIFWEVEYDKWGIYSRTVKDERINSVALFIGKSILDKKMNPIPVFTADSLGIFDEVSNILEKVSRHNKKQVSIMIEMILAILKDNYGEKKLDNNALLKESKELIGSLSFSNKSFGTIYEQIKSKLSNNEKILFSLILKLRSKYGC